MTGRRWRRRPDGSNWGEFGDEDQLGRLNLLTPEVLRRARDEIVTGERFSLALSLDYPGGQVLSRHRRPPKLYALTTEEGLVRYNLSSERTDVECDDEVTLSLQYSTHWDGLAHMGSLFDADGDGVPEKVYYNGVKAHVDISPPRGACGTGHGAGRLGLENAAAVGIAGRGVLIDLKAHIATGDGPVKVGFERLREIMAEEKVNVERGDIVCLNTGFSDLLLSMRKHPVADIISAHSIGLDGSDARLLDWISETELVAIAADNYAVEAYPAGPLDSQQGPELPLHEHCLFKLGVYLGELWHLSALARALKAQGRTRFFLSATPLNLPGAVGSPLTPVAII